MSEELIQLVLERSLSLGAEYCEARLQRNIDQIAILRNGNPEPSVFLDSNGIGVRIVYDGAMSFVATNLLTKESVGRLAESAVKRARSASLILKKKIQLGRADGEGGKWVADEKERLEDVTIDEMMGVLKELDDHVMADNGIDLPSRLLFLRTMIEKKHYVNSDGAKLESQVPRVQFHSILAMKYEGRTSTITVPAGYAQLGGSGGMEILDRFDLFNYFPRRLSEISDAIKAETKPPQGELDVVLGPEITGLVAHESSGHPSEADRILGREAAQAGESYIGSTDVGKKIGSEEVYVSDDPTIPHSMGYYKYDDEGIRGRKRHLISGGIITELLHNRETALELGVSSNGASRSMGYNREPIIRMSNTYVEPGDYDHDELFEDVRSGVYFKSFMEWNIDDRRMNQRYVGLEAFSIEAGEIGAPIKDPVLEISTSRLWSSLDARGKDLSFTSATCGKGDPMQAAPVWTGGPHIRLRKVRVSRRVMT